MIGLKTGASVSAERVWQPPIVIWQNPEYWMVMSCLQVCRCPLDWCHARSGGHGLSGRLCGLHMVSAIRAPHGSYADPGHGWKYVRMP